ncbi:cold-shock protein [Haloterrigena alkaliphila]|uniref:cold-shock protein n=1 Tax=Haloterrigena alkaliphila TaxID=2816475 RepID=UPI001CFFCB66|nr:cold shock domain-containing protein [Haloterrigena alkaliphila]UHQ95091.1 cold shock domain-containing protein [Haloterrigena alkaliphila]
MARGRVRFLSDRETYGFIERDGYGQDVFLHRADVEHGPVEEGSRVEFDVTSADRGPRARNIRVTS